MPTNDAIETHERLARIEEALEAIRAAIQDQKECSKGQNGKLDKILKNDTDKLVNIAKNKTSIKNIHATLYVLFAGLTGLFIKSLF